MNQNRLSDLTSKLQDLRCITSNKIVNIEAEVDEVQYLLDEVDSLLIQLDAEVSNDSLQ